MKHESSLKKKLEVKEVKFNLDTYIENYIKDENLKDEVKNANIILLPYNNFREIKGPIFFENNAELYDYLLTNTKDKKVEICVEEEDYKEIALHDELINLGIIFLQDVALTVVAGLILEYIKNKIDSRKPKVEVTLIEKEEKSYKEFKYEGDPEYLSETLDSYLTKRNKNDN